MLSEGQKADLLRVGAMAAGCLILLTPPDLWQMFWAFEAVLGWVAVIIIVFGDERKG